MAYPTLVSAAGNLAWTCSFIFMGPLPSVGFDPSWSSITVAVGLAGSGFGCLLVSSFGRAQNAAFRKGFPKDIDTYLMVSGKIWLLCNEL